MSDGQRFDALCARVETWPHSCPDNAEWELMLKASHEAFRKGSVICEALKVLYVKHAMLRPVVDILFNVFSDQFCAKYRG